MEFLLGLPHLRGALLAKAIELGAPVLVSANSFSTWTNSGEPFLWPRRSDGKFRKTRMRQWKGFRVPPAPIIQNLRARLDSAGFVAAREYNGFPWAVDDYLDLCAAAPWSWFASMDWCVEPEIARDDAAVLDRISGTVRLNIACAQGARERGIADRLMPVIQGWRPEQYLRCMDRLGALLDGATLVGVGSMCRRHVEGSLGVLQVIDALDRAAPPGMRFHLFGLKSQAAYDLRGHPRVASVDSQAYGVQARQISLKNGKDHSKSDAFVAEVMQRWYEEQMRLMGVPWHRPRSVNSLLALPDGTSANGVEAALARARDEMRELHEAGEIEWSDVGPHRSMEWAFLDDE